ncbi:MAG: tRNA (5-methylaminomethyl-2-thiouridine)(34)-methyltransferase MnmD [Gammaproteobacteria bacterium]|nr:tRNA (5-methylaminomethyl-2-thiouridine)(34)-methyltransferase MnmD [Gammaproteobacteria bacterium]
MSEKTAQISWMPSGEPFSELFQDFYFSTDGGFQETEYVFLKQNNIVQRFLALQEAPDDTVFRIGETGFGTGLNFLVTLYHWLQISDLNCILEYTTVEKYPLTKLQLEEAYKTFKKTWPQLSLCCDELLSQYPQEIAHSDDSSSSHQIELFDGKICLNLIINDATLGLKQLLPTEKTMDAWYLDGFAPAKNPDMWQMELFNTLFALSQSGTTLSTFTSAGVVRRGLIEAGFEMSKIPGLGKKREILLGVYPEAKI